MQCKRTAEIVLILYLQQSQHDPDRETGQPPYNRRPVRGGMAPPPVPVDPAIDSWRPSNAGVSPGLGLDNLLQFSPKSFDRLSLLSQSNLDTTFPQELQLPAMKQNPNEPNPLMRFWTEPGPWNPHRISGDPRQVPTNPQFAGFGDSMRRNTPALQYDYRSPRSEIGSSTTGGHPLDSGYGGSKSLATTSARSVDQFDQSRSCQSISGDVQDFHLYSEDSYQDIPARNRLSSHPQYSSVDVACEPAQQSGVTFELVCRYPNCGAMSKNHSEYR